MNTINSEILIAMLHKLETNVATLSSIVVCFAITQGLSLAILIAIWCSNLNLLSGGAEVLAVFGLPIAFFAFFLSLLLLRRLWVGMRSQ